MLLSISMYLYFSVGGVPENSRQPNSLLKSLLSCDGLQLSNFVYFLHKLYPLYYTQIQFEVKHFIKLFYMWINHSVSPQFLPLFTPTTTGTFGTSFRVFSRGKSSKTRSISFCISEITLSTSFSSISNKSSSCT